MKKTKYFPNRVLFWKHVEQYCEGLDINRTLRLPTLYFSKGGVDFRSGSMKELLTKLNAEFGCSFDEDLSRNAGQKFTLFYKGVEDKKESKATSPLISLEVETKEEEPEVVVAEDASPTVEDVVDTTEASETASEVDWEHIWSLDKPDDKSGSKDALEKYCIATFKIDLRKNQTFANMIKELKGKLEI